MSPSLPNPRTVLRNATDLARGVDVMRRRQLFDPRRPDHALLAILNVSRFGPFAGVVTSVAHRNPDAPAIQDERGTLTYGEVDGQANALVRGLAARGITAGSVVALLARDHRGLVLPLLACGKLGVRVVLMNTGFAKPQFADVAEREKVGAVLHDSEFVDLLDAIPHEIPRILTWVDERDGVDPSTLDPRRPHRGAAHRQDRSAEAAGRHGDPHLGHHRDAEGRSPRQGFRRSRPRSSSTGCRSRTAAR